MADDTADRPRIPSKQWLLAAGRDLMDWWNQQGVTLPREGERYRIWWQSTFQHVEGSWTPVVRGDIAETLDRYVAVAHRWHKKHNGKGGNPPLWKTPEGLIPSVGFGAGAAVVAAVLVAAVLLFRR